MTKLMLLTILLVVPGASFVGARRKDPRNGLKVTLGIVTAWVALYFLFLLKIWPRLASL